MAEENVVAEESAGPAEEGGSKQKRLTPNKYARAVLLWELGNHSLADICTAIDYPNASYLGRRLRQGGVIKGSRAKETEDAARAEVNKSVQKDAILAAQRIKDTKDEFYALNTFIRRALRSKMAEVVKNKGRFDSIYAEVKTLKAAQDLLSTGTDQAWRLLGLDKDFNGDEELPPLIITELTAEEVEQIQREPGDNGLEDLGETTNAELSPDDPPNDEVAEEDPDEVVAEE